MACPSDVLTAASEELAAEALYAAGRSDGLPVVVPTQARVAAMLSCAAGLEPDMALGDLAPSGGRLTVEKAAVNAVMAGCAPEMFPLVIAACEALVDPLFDAGPMQNTTHPVTPLIIVNGPARALYNVNSGIGALGPGARANATLGRAIRLIMINVGGGRPGVGDMASLGSPAKFTCCLAEAEEASPFEPLHVSRGFRPEDSVVTLLGVEGPHSVIFSFDDAHSSGDQLLKVIGAALANPGSNNIYQGKGMVAVVLNPLHARLLAEDQGWTREEVQARLYGYAAMAREELRSLAGARADSGTQAGDTLRVVQKPTDFLIMVGGDEGGAYSACFPTWGVGEHGNIAVSRKVRTDAFCEIPASLRTPEA